MLIAFIAVIVAVFLVLAMIGYRMGPPPGGEAITQRDERLLEQRADVASLRRVANPHLRDDRQVVIQSMAEAAVEMARREYESRPTISDTEALAVAFRTLDTLERDGNNVALGSIAGQMADYLISVGVLHQVDPSNPELPLLTADVIRSDPGTVVEIATVKDLYAWPVDR